MDGLNFNEKNWDKLVAENRLLKLVGEKKEDRLKEYQSRVDFLAKANLMVSAELLSAQKERHWLWVNRCAHYIESLSVLAIAVYFIWSLE